MASSGESFKTSCSGDETNLLERDADSRNKENTKQAFALEQGDVLPGAVLSQPEYFQKNQSSANISLTPVIVDFRRLLQCQSAIPVIKGVSDSIAL